MEENGPLGEQRQVLDTKIWTNKLEYQFELKHHMEDVCALQEEPSEKEVQHKALEKKFREMSKYLPGREKACDEGVRIMKDLLTELQDENAKCDDLEEAGNKLMTI